jgi:signal transduction histidine kinase
VHLLRLQERGGGENLIEHQAREVIERQVGNLTKIVSDLLEVSRVVSGRVRLDRQTVDLNQVIQHSIETVTPLIEQHRHKLVLNLCPEPMWCDVDATRIEEVFINLLNDITRARKSGFDAHLVKPFDLDELERLMGAYGKCPAAS